MDIVRLLFKQFDRVFIEKGASIIEDGTLQHMFYLFGFLSRYIILNGKVEVEESGKDSVIIDEPVSSFLHFSEVLQVLLHSPVHLVLLSFLYDIVNSCESCHKCTAPCPHTPS